MEIPKEVLKVAKGLVDEYGPRFEYLGESNGLQVFMFAFPDDVVTGFPSVFYYNEKEKTAFRVSGMMAVQAIASFGVE